MANIREKQRRETINSIKITLQEAREQDKVLNKDRLIANICLRYGVSRKTALDYLSTLIDSGSVQVMWENKDGL